MKKLVCLLLIMSAALTVSCNKNEVGNTSLAGRWDLNKQSFTYTKDGVVIDQSSKVFAPGDAIFELNSDGTWVIYDGGIDKGKYVRTGSYLFITYDQSDVTSEYIIETLTSSTLVLVSDEDRGEVHIRKRLELTRL